MTINEAREIVEKLKQGCWVTKFARHGIVIDGCMDVEDLEALIMVWRVTYEPHGPQHTEQQP